jgi:hypothetical protein
MQTLKDLVDVEKNSKGTQKDESKEKPIRDVGTMRPTFEEGKKRVSSVDLLLQVTHVSVDD